MWFEYHWWSCFFFLSMMPFISAYQACEIGSGTRGNISAVWDWKARLYDENLSVPQSQCQNSSGELGDVGDGGRLRCLHGKVDTTILRMCYYCL